MRILVILGLALAVALTGAWFARVDVLAPARGEVVARERTRAVQAPEPGVVAALHVEEGARVRAGALLLALDDTVATSGIRRLEAELRRAREMLAQLRASGVRDGAVRMGTAADAVFAASEEGAASGQQQLRALERARLDTALAEVDRRIEASERQSAVIAAERRWVARQLPVVHEQVEALARLAADAHVSRHEYLRELARHIELGGRAESLAFESERQAAEIGRLRMSRHLLGLEQEVAWQREWLEAEAAAERLHEELVQARQRRAWHRVFAPVDGVVQDLGELAAGSYVERGQRLMVLVPADGGLEIRAYVRNRDVGFVRAGQEAIVKIDAFPFTRYGTTRGVVRSVSLDTVAVDGGGVEAAGAVEAGARYLARVDLIRPALEIDGALVPLRPGMAAVVDVRTGKRRLLEYVIAPFIRYGSNAFRER